jgi:glycosyltransferase involved in cell wall biosynthesis
LDVPRAEPILSIVIACRDDAGRLERTLNSLADQDVASRVELVIQDAASQDDTSAIVGRFEALLDMTFQSAPDQGVYDGMNRGAARTQGEFVLFLNAGDTFYDHDSLQLILGTVSNHPGALWYVFGALHHYGGRGRPGVIRNQPHVWWRHALGLQAHCHQATVFRADVFRSMHGYSLDYDFAGDFDLILRFGILAPPVECPELVINYEGGGTSEVRRADISRLRHAVRVDRLQLKGHARYADRVAGQLVWIRTKSMRLGRTAHQAYLRIRAD